MIRIPTDHRILVVGADEPTQTTLSKAFALVGLEGDYVPSSDEALSAYLRRDPIELAFVSLMLEDGEGPTLLEDFHRHRPAGASIPVFIALSHGGAGDLGKRALAAGAIAILKKPLVAHELDLALRAALRAVRTKRSARAANRRKKI